MRLLQWIVGDLNVFRDQWANNRSALRFVHRRNDDGTDFYGFDITSFPPELIIGASPNIAPLLDPMLAIPYIDQPHPPPTKQEMDRRLSRDRALQRWHTDPSIKLSFEEYWLWLQKQQQDHAA